LLISTTSQLGSWRIVSASACVKAALLRPWAAKARSLKPMKPITVQSIQCGSTQRNSPRQLVHGTRRAVALARQSSALSLPLSNAAATCARFTSLSRTKRTCKRSCARTSPVSRACTPTSKLYGGMDEHFIAHETVKHSAKEYVRDDIHTNSAEGYFS